MSCFIDIDDDDHGYKSALSRELLSKPNLSNLWNLSILSLLGSPAPPYICWRGGLHVESY